MFFSSSSVKKEEGKYKDFLNRSRIPQSSMQILQIKYLY